MILLTAEAQYSINFSRSNRKSCLSLHYNGNSYNNTTATATIATVFYLLMLQIYIYQFKAKDSEKKIYTLCLGNISGDFSANNMKKTGLNGCVYGFSVDYRAFDTSNIINIHKYVIKKCDIK